MQKYYCPVCNSILKKEKGVEIYNNLQELQNLKIFQSYHKSVKTRKIYIALCQRDENDIHLTDFSQLERIVVTSAQTFQIIGYDWGESRNIAVLDAIKRGFDFIFFVDSDIILPKNTLSILKAHQVPIIGGVYYRKKNPLLTANIYIDKDGYTYVMKDDSPTTGLIDNVITIPTGCCLIDLNIFKQLNWPWFKAIIFNNNNFAMTDDQYFCQLVREKQIPLYVDLSIQCLHIDKINKNIYGHRSIVENNIIKNPEKFAINYKICQELGVIAGTTQLQQQVQL